MMTMMMIMIKQRVWKDIQVYEQPEVRPTYTTYIKQYFLFFCRNLHGRFSFGTQICFNGLLQEPITSAPVYYWESLNAITFMGGGGGIVQRLKMDIRHDEETDVFQGAW